jgi:hypothetical protein
VTSSRDLNAARIALAEARIRLELNRLIAICAEDLAAAQAAFEAGIATEQEVAKARQALAKARQRLAANRVGPH